VDILIFRLTTQRHASVLFSSSQLACDYGGGTRRRRELYLLFRTIVAADGINSCVDVTENAWRTFKLRRRALSLTAAAHV